MAGIIKGQILKHLSKFTKNLSPDKIHVSTLKGEGELSNLELDDRVLTDLLDLPTWLRLTKAVCNRVAIKIQWTKLKSQPICLYLDEIVVEMETCEDPRNPQEESPISSYSTGGKYGFAERIIDGMFVSINSIIVNFKAQAFAASIQISRIRVQSRTPTWQNGDLRLTRVKDEHRGEVLIFKEAEWQTLRIEANAMSEDPHVATTPLRLIANQSKVRITIRKRLLDCGIVASRLQVNLDDLLWVLTDAQLKAALTFVNSLRDIVQRSAKQSKKLAAEKLKKQGETSSPATTPKSPSHTQKPTSRSQQAIAALFDKYNVQETSYHLHTGRIDLHLCDDNAPDDDELVEEAECIKDEDYKRKVEGGAMQLTLFKLSFDYYPYHPAGQSRSHWIKYDENMAARDMWSADLLSAFKEDVRRVREAYSSPQDSPTHIYREGEPQADPPGGTTGRPQTLKTDPRVVQPPAPRSTRLLESCLLFRLEDFTLYQVSTAADNKRRTPRKFFASDKKQLLLPPEMSSLHAEYTDYYFPEGIDYPVPHANLFMVVNPFRLVLDYTTILWLNAFALNLLKRALNLSLLFPELLDSEEIPNSEDPKIHVDIKLDALMPRIILPAETEIRGQSDRPESLQIQISRLTLTNSRIEPKSSQAELGATLVAFENGRLFQDTKDNLRFPKSGDDMESLPDAFRHHLDKSDGPYFDKAVEDILLRRKLVPNGTSHPAESRGEDGPESTGQVRRSESYMGLTYYNMRADSFKMDADKDIWCLVVDQFWMEFIGVPSSRNRPVPFVESFPLTVWISRPIVAAQSKHSRPRPPRQSDYSWEGQRSFSDQSDWSEDDAIEPRPRPADIHVLVKIHAAVHVQLNHYQFLFLMRLLETITKYQTEIEEDTLQIIKTPPPEKRVVAAVIIKELELALICPPIPELPSLSRDDCESLTDAKEAEVLNGQTLDVPTKEGEDSALGQSINSPGNLSAPQPVIKSHSDGEIVTTHVTTNGTEVLHTARSGLGSEAEIDRIHEGHAGEASHYPRLVPDSGPTSGSGSPLNWSPAHQVHYNVGSESSGFQSGSQSNLSQISQNSQDRKQQDLKKSINSTFSSFSKGLTGSFRQIKDTVKQKLDVDEGSQYGDEWERMSVKSGASSDDDEISLLMRFQEERERPAFEHRYPPSEDATSAVDSVRDADSASVNTLSMADGVDRMAHGVVSIVCFRLYDIEVIAQLDGKDVSALGQVYHIIPDEKGNTNLDKFQARFASGPVDDVKPELPEVTDPPVKFRYCIGPKAETVAPSAGERGFIQAKVENLTMSLVLSTASNLTDLIEDEKIPESMPMLILVSNCDFNLKNDKPPTHITSPGPQPLDLHIHRVIVRREKDGIFQITGDMSPTAASIAAPEHRGIPKSISIHEDLDATLNDELSPEKVTISHDDWLSLQQVLHENELLKQRLIQTEDDLRLARRPDRKVENKPKPEVVQVSRDEYDGLVEENDILRRQLEKIGKMSLSSGEFNVNSLQTECARLKDESRGAERLRAENEELIVQITRQSEEVVVLKQERESLLTTIQLLQEELEASEAMRNQHK